MLNQNGSSKADTLVKLVLIFFISLLSFSVGTFVGKQFSDSQYKMAALESGEGDHAGENGDVDAARDTASVDPKSMDVEPKDALTEEDVASLQDELVNTKGTEKDVKSSVTAEKNADSHEAEAKPKIKDVTTATASKVAHGESPVTKVDNPADRLPSSVPARVSADLIGKYTVQISSYNNESDATEHTKALKAKGYSAFYVPAQIKGKTWFRVSIGLFTTLKEAEESKKKLVGKEEIKSALVQKIVQ